MERSQEPGGTWCRGPGSENTSTWVGFPLPPSLDSMELCAGLAPTRGLWEEGCPPQVPFKSQATLALTSRFSRTVENMGRVRAAWQLGTGARAKGARCQPRRLYCPRGLLRDLSALSTRDLTAGLMRLHV